MPTPDGADAQTFAMLKTKLRAMLIARQAGKVCRKAPITPGSKVTNLFVVPESGGARFTWTYRNVGDYDQNGAVNVGDLTLLGIHWGKNSSAIDWALARPADGNSDGVIDIRDLTSIGVGFGDVVTRYMLEYSPVIGVGEYWALGGEVLFSLSAVDLDGLRKFEHFMPSAARGYFRVVPCDLEEAGIPSNVVPWGINGQGDWFMFGHDRQHTRRSPFTGPATSHLKWSSAIGGSNSITSPVVGITGTIYVGSYDTKLYAINPNGTLKWTFGTGSFITSSPAISADGTIYIGSDDNNPYAVTPEGTMKWVFGAGVSVYSSPAIGADGTVYYSDLNANLFAVGPGGG